MRFEQVHGALYIRMAHMAAWNYSAPPKVSLDFLPKYYMELVLTFC